MLGPEIGPGLLEKDELRIGRLPEKEIADPELAARPDDEVHARELPHLGSPEMVLHQLARHLLGLAQALGDILGKERGRAHELGATAVGDRQYEIELRVALQALDGALDN